MDYRGYSIEREMDHVVITRPDGSQWTEDSIKDAKASIDIEEKESI